MYDTLKPGGWVQFAEYATELKSDDNRYVLQTKNGGGSRYVPPNKNFLLTYIRECSYPPDCALRKYFSLFHKAAGRTGRAIYIAHKIKDITSEVGFIEAPRK